MITIDNPLSRYYRCAENSVPYKIAEPLSDSNGLFRIGRTAIGFGRYNGRHPSKNFAAGLRDALEDVRIDNGIVLLPFDPAEVAENLRCESYVEDWRSTPTLSLLADVYYFFRPFLPDGIRRRLQKLYLTVRGENPFPSWPIDSSVDDM